MKALTLLLGLASIVLGSVDTAKPTIVLVHGAFADGSSWARVIPLLENDGYTVIAVQNPLTSLGRRRRDNKTGHRSTKGAGCCRWPLVWRRCDHCRCGR